MYRANFLDVIMSALLIIGGLNWGSIAIFDYNFVSALFGVDTPASNIIYALVGLSALYSFFVGFSRAANYPRRVAY